VQLLRVLSVSGLFIAIALTYTGGLQGTGRHQEPALHLDRLADRVPLGICFVISSGETGVGTLQPIDIWIAILVGHATRCALSVLPVQSGASGAVAKNVAAAVKTGVAGLSIEDSTGDEKAPLFDFSLSVERMRAARRAIDASGTGVLLVGRSEGFIVGRPDLAETIRRLTAYAEAGAECLYAPGLRSMGDIKAVVDAVAPRPVNVLVGSDFATVEQLAAIGVRRISVGGALARAAWAGFIAAATEIAEQGTFGALGRAAPSSAIERAFD
jgi:hypothetical protein